MSRTHDRRAPSEVLARARILNLVSTLAEGFPVEELAPDVPRFGLEDALTRDEAAWLGGQGEPGADVAWQGEAMLALAWAIGLAPALGDRDPEAYGPIQERLADESAGDAMAARSDDELLAMLAHVDACAAAGEEPPLRERYGAEALRWRRAALRWALDRSLAWPP
jgi:hypothetical protein